MLFPVAPPARVLAHKPSPPTTAQITSALESAARRHRIPTGLLFGLAWHYSRWDPRFEQEGRVGVLGVPTTGRSDSERLRSDWEFNIEEGARYLELCWNRAPILGNGRLEDGRNILECWFYALGRYGVGKEGAAAHLFANAVLDALASGGEGRFEPIAVTRPSAEKLSWGRGAPSGPPAPWHFGEVKPLPASPVVVNLAVPYVMQVWDMPDGFDGSGACGPSSMTMLLGFLDKVAPRPVSPSVYPHTNNWGGNVPEIYKQVCEPGLGAIHAKMIRFFKPQFPTVAIVYNEKATWKRVKSELDAGRPVILGTQMTPAGHIVVARGYLADGRVIVNDPAGNQTVAARAGRPDAGWSPTGNRYWNGEGEGAVYEWEAMSVRWVMTFGPSTDSDRPEDEAKP